MILLVNVGQLPYLLPGNQHLDELDHQRLVPRRPDHDLERLVMEQVGKDLHNLEFKVKDKDRLDARLIAGKITKSSGIRQETTGLKRGFLSKNESLPPVIRQKVRQRLLAAAQTQKTI